MGVMKTLTINGTTYSVVPIVPALSVTLLANEWVKEGDTYSQVVGVAGVTSHSKVDLQPTPEQLEEFHYKVLAFVAENDGGKVTVYAVGDKPDGDHTIQVTLTEVDGTGKIRGNTVGTTMPRANLEQEDPQQADYVGGKEAFLQKIADRGLSNALTINGNSYNGESPLTVDTSEFVVTVTGTQADGYTSDKTYAETCAAHDAGRTVACLFNGEMFSGFRIPLAMVEDGLLLFLFMPIPGAGVVVNLMDGAVEASEMLLDVTIGGQTWQMDEPVDFTDTINGMIDAKIAKIPSYVRTEAERLASVVQARQNENTVSAILSSDYHLPQPSHAYYAQILESITHAGQAMSILRSRLSLDFEAKLGDLIWDATETPAEALKSFQVVHSLASEGNVLDRYEGNGNHDHLQSNDAPLTDAQVYANIGIYNKGCVRDDANRVGGYCYKDYDEFMLRVVLLNTSEANDGSFAMSSKQIEWMSEALNVPVEEGWGILILSHHPLDWGGSSTAVMKKIKAASGIIANLHGHVHTFTQDVITGTEIPRLAIPNVCFYRNNEYGQNGKAENSEGIEFGTTTTYSKTPKSATDTSFCVLTLDRATGKLYLDRYGAGIDREETVPTWGKLGYTNLVPTSEAADSTEPYNAVGYKNGVYLSSNGGDSTDEACVATGYIPYTWATKNSIYVKGAEVSSASHVRIYGYSAKGSAPVGSATCSGPNLSTYFTVEELGTNYYRLTPLSSNATGVVYLRLSLIGTGENLIVTVNEPIE